MHIGNLLIYILQIEGFVTSSFLPFSFLKFVFKFDNYEWKNIYFSLGGSNRIFKSFFKCKKDCRIFEVNLSIDERFRLK